MCKSMGDHGYHGKEKASKGRNQSRPAASADLLIAVVHFDIVVPFVPPLPIYVYMLYVLMLSQVTSLSLPILSLPCSI